MVTPAKVYHISVIIIENQRKQFALQLKGNKSPRHVRYWVLFGGYVEAGEAPFQTAVREIREELTVSVDQAQLYFLGSFRLEPNKIHSLFHYAVSNDLDTAILTEGEEWGWFEQALLEQGQIGEIPILPTSRKLLHWYLQRKGNLGHIEPRAS